MKRFNVLLNSVSFRKILVIFVIGLVSRGVVNYVYEINVFKEYSNIISLVYYGLMISFSGFVYELPKISFSVSSFKSIKDSIKIVCSNYFLVSDKDKVLLGGDMFNNPLDNKDVKNNLFYNNEEEPKYKSKGRSSRSVKSAGVKSAGVEALYGGGRKATGRTPAGLGGLYGFEEKSNKPSKHVHRSRKSIPQSIPKIIITDADLDRKGRNKSISKPSSVRDNVFEKDGNGVYELDGKNLPVELAGRNLSNGLDRRNVYELPGEGVVGYSRNGYIPYRPKPVELDSIPKRVDNPWSPESYGKTNNFEKREVNRVENSKRVESSKRVDNIRGVNKVDSLYMNSNTTESTLLGTVQGSPKIKTDKMIERNTYSKGFIDGVNAAQNIPKPSRKEKLVGMLLDRVIK